jgi:hypothetical protein
MDGAEIVAQMIVVMQLYMKVSFFFLSSFFRYFVSAEYVRGGGREA